MYGNATEERKDTKPCQNQHTYAQDRKENRGGRAACRGIIHIPALKKMKQIK